MDFVVYTRVSTREQGLSGLGLEAQRASIERYIEGQKGTIIASFEEIASGKGGANRPLLQKAVQQSIQAKAALIVAKLDRLGRDIIELHEIRKELDIVIADRPNMSLLEFSMVAAMAQEERETISKRTVEALKAKKARGFKLGTPSNLTDTSRQRSIQSRKETAMQSDYNLNAKAIIEDNKGLSMQKLADKINRYGVRTSTGKLFTVATVAHIIKMYGIDRSKQQTQSTKGV